MKNYTLNPNMTFTNVTSADYLIKPGLRLHPNTAEQRAIDPMVEAIARGVDRSLVSPPASRSGGR